MVVPRRDQLSWRFIDTDPPTFQAHVFLRATNVWRDSVEIADAYLNTPYIAGHAEVAGYIEEEPGRVAPGLVEYVNLPPGEPMHVRVFLSASPSPIRHQHDLKARLVVVDSLNNRHRTTKLTFRFGGHVRPS